MRTRTFWMSVLGGLAVVFGGAFLGSEPSPHASEATAPLVLACRFQAEDRLEFKIRAEVDTGTGPTSGDIHQVLGARMKWRVLRQDEAGGWLVAAMLSDVELDAASATDPAYRGALEEPFLFHVSQDCGFHGFAFRPTRVPRAQVRMQSLLQGMELRLPAPPSSSFWTASHEDGLGQYTALYRRTGVTQEGEAMLSRARGPYTRLSGMAAGALQAKVMKSAAALILDREGRWLQRLEGQEHLILSSQGKVLADTRQRLDLRRVEAQEPFPEELDLAAFVSTDPAAELGKEPPPPDPRLRGMALSQVLDEVAALLKQDDRPAHEIAEVLAQYLRLHPEQARQLMAELKARRYEDRVHALAFLALEMTGTPEAQTVLVEALSDRELRAMDRMRAAVALPDVPVPSRESVEGLIDMARRLRHAQSREEEEVAGTALRALGTLSSKVERTQPELSQLARSEIRAELSTARGMNEVTAAIDAIGNTGDEGLAGELERFQQDDSSVVRARSALAYRRMEPAVAAPSLSDWLNRETDGTVRQSIIDAMLQVSQAGGGAPAPDSAVATAAAQLASEQDPRTRELLIQLLGTAARSSPAARTALAMHFHREPLPQLLSLLGRYIGPEDLN